MGFEQPKFNNESIKPEKKEMEENDKNVTGIDKETQKKIEEGKYDGLLKKENEKLENNITGMDKETWEGIKEGKYNQLLNKEEGVQKKIKVEEPKKDREEKQEEPKPKAESKELKLEKEIVINYYEELEKIRNIPENTNGLKKQKAEKYFELIDSWKDLGHKDNYKGIQKIISELDKLEPGAWFYNLAKTQNINELAITMASNYKEWGLESKEKTKLIKKIIDKQKKGIWENKDKTLKQVAEILASQEIPYKDNIDFIIKDIKNPDIKTEAITKISNIEKKSIEQKKQLLRKIKEEAKEEKINTESLEKTASSLGLDKLLGNPEAISKMFAESSELMKNPEIQKKWQEINKTIEKIIKEKNKPSSLPDSVKKAKESIKKPGSNLETIFGAAGWIILLFLTLFMLAELKGVDYLVQQSSGGKKK
jgi:hypothetical protein